MSPFTFDPHRAQSPSHPYQAELCSELGRAVAQEPKGSRLFIHIATGGGKTRIANDAIGKSILPAGKRVLWVTKDWNLLQQAAADLAQRFNVASSLGVVGDRGRSELPGLRETADARVVYTSVQTWVARRNDDFRRQRFDVVFIDELHWGEKAPSYRKLFNRYCDGAVFVGLTATPRPESSWKRVGKSWSLGALINDGILARPVLEKPLHTGVRWSPARSVPGGDFTAPSLENLATDTQRNRLIVETLAARHRRYGQTIVFACNIAHAVDLAGQLQLAGLSAEAIHSSMAKDDQREALTNFRTGRTSVLVNVAQLTHGVDIPSIRTVVLARPTTSPTLFAQMIGRGTRRQADKSEFYLLDCVDDLQTDADAVMRAETFCKDVASVASRPPAPRDLRTTRHTYERANIITIPRNDPLPEIAGLEIQPRQTFGVEIELTRSGFCSGEKPCDWPNVSRKLLLAIGAHAPAAGGPCDKDSKDNTVWNVEWDSSCGWEITSPILRGENGFREVVRVCRALEAAVPRIGLKVDLTTGLHVHLGVDAKAGLLRRTMTIAAAFEPALMSLVAPSRFNNQYCSPVRGRIAALARLSTLDEWRDAFSEYDTRYLAVNPRNALAPDGLGTMEVRLHSGTFEAAKILAWTSLWMRIIEAAERGVALDVPTTAPEAMSAKEDGDIAAMCDVLKCGAALLERLIARRNHVVSKYWSHDAIHGARARIALRAWQCRQPRDNGLN